MRTKKLLSSLLTASMLLTSAGVTTALPVMSTTAFAETTDFTYNVNDDGESVEVLSYTGSAYATKIVIPDTIDDLPVTAIGGGAFISNEKITSVTIPETVTVIGDAAFSGCTALETVNMPAALKKIGVGAFINCTGLTSLTFNDGLKEIGNNAFQGSRLGSAALPGSVEFIGEYAFNTARLQGTSNSALTSVTFGSNSQLKEIGDGAFWGTRIKTVTIPNSVTKLGVQVFKDCKQLETVTLSQNITEIPDSLLYGCSKLGAITIPKNVRRIGEWAFYNCVPLQTVTIPNGVEKIEKSAFKSCNAITSVTIGNAVKSIGESAFGSCSALTTLNMGNSVETISKYAFENTKIKTVQLPYTVKEIGYLAFYSGYLQEMTICKNSKLVLENFLGSNSPLIKFEGTEEEWDKLTSGISISNPSGKPTFQFNTPVSDALKHEHEYGDPEELTASTCMTLGEDVTICDDCGARYYTEKTANGYHAYEDVGNGKEATCTVDGKTSDKVCKYCGKKQKGETIKALGHKYPEGSETKPATCTEPGETAGGECENCGEKLPAGATPALGHDFSKPVLAGTPATCTTKGKEPLNKCSRCEETKGGAEIEPQHTFGEWKVVTPATCGAEGEEKRVCTQCKDPSGVETRPIEKTSAHTSVSANNAVAVTCTDAGHEADTVCDVCGTVRENGATIAAGGHKYVTVGSDVAETCSKDGKKADQKCSVCGDILEGATIPKDTSKHNLVSANNAKPATCTAAGKETDMVCSECKQTITPGKTLPATGHTPKSAGNAVAATCTTNGKEADTVCSVCKETITAGAVITAKGHAFNTGVEYTWAADFSTCTASRECALCSTVEKETVTAEVTTKPATYSEEGETTYTATFTNAAFKPQTETVNTDVLSFESPTDLEISKLADTSVTLVWEAGAGAQGYEVQLYDNSEGKWTTAKTISDANTLTCKVTGLKSGSSYKLRVRAFVTDNGKKVYSNWTDTVSAVMKPTKVANFRVTKKAKKNLTLSWKKHAAATGYQIQMKTSGSWKTVKTITSKSKTTLKVTKLKKNTAYNFRIRAYKKNGSKKIYSDYVTIKAKTAK